MSSSPISPIFPSSSTSITPLVRDVETILQEHTASLPSFSLSHVGCNVLLMPTGAPPSIASVGHLDSKAAAHWASVSKQFTAAAIARLVASHCLSYDTDIRTILDLPPFTLDGIERPITINDLLYMRSGLSEVIVLAALSGKRDEDLTMEDKLDLIKRHPKLLFAPGEKMMYCNSNYLLLAKIIETRIAPKTFFAFLRDEVLPKEMQGRCVTDPTCPACAEGFPHTTRNREYGSSGIIAPITDMIFWNASIARNDCPDLREPPKGVSLQINAFIYCRGLFMMPIEGGVILQHAGAIEGFRTLYWRYEDDKHPLKSFAFFIIANSEDLDQGEALDKICNCIAVRIGKKLPESISHAPEEITKMTASKEEVESYRGTFRCLELGSTDLIEIIEEDSTWKIVHILNPVDGATAEKIKNSPHFFPVQRNQEGRVTDFTAPEDGAHIQFSPDGQSFILQIDNKLAPLTFMRSAV